MNAGRILPTKQQLSTYSSSRLLSRNKKARKPIDAITFDVLEISEQSSDLQAGYSWLIAHISTLSDDEVAAKMRVYSNSITDIDDAVAEKVFMEVL